MDDPKTHHMLDALADLFLTGYTGPGTSPPAPIRLPPKLPNAAPPAATADNDSPSQVTSPKPASHVSPSGHSPDIIGSIGPLHSSASPSASAYPHTHADQTHSRHGRVPHLHGVILGSLPGFALPWLTQYAHHLAEQLGPTILMRIDSAGMTFDLISAQRGPVSDNGNASGKALSSIKASSPVELIDRLLHDAYPGQVPAQALVVEAEDPLVLSHLRLPRVTLVCGAYESALQDAAVKIRDLVTRCQTQGQPVPNLGVMIMGSDAHRADQALLQLNQLLAQVPVPPVVLRGHRQQMVPVRLQVASQFNHDPHHDRDLRAYFEELAAMDPQPIESTPATTADSPVSPAPVPTAWSGSIESDIAPVSEPAFADSPILSPQPSTTIQTSTTSQATGAVHSATPTHAMPVEPREVIAASISEPATVADARFHTSSHTPQHTTIPESEATFATAQPDRSMAPASMTAAPISQDAPARSAEPSAYHDTEPDLPRLLAPILPGALPLQARCPRHPQTQLFLDTQGQVHLAAMSGPEPSDLPAAVVSLMETRQWVHEHFELLQLTQRQCRFDITQPPQLHLLTPQAPLAVGLIHRLGKLLRVHLLQQVHIQQASTWLCTPLS